MSVAFAFSPPRVDTVLGVPEGARCRVRLRAGEYGVAFVKRNGTCTRHLLEVTDTPGVFTLGPAVDANQTIIAAPAMADAGGAERGDAASALSPLVSVGSNGGSGGTRSPGRRRAAAKPCEAGRHSLGPVEIPRTSPEWGIV